MSNNFKRSSCFAVVVTQHIREFAARGSQDYQAPAKDNSAEERAVEVHVSFLAAQPTPPPNLVRAKPLPGGPRCARWAVAAPGGITVTVAPGLVVAANIVVFRCCEGHGAGHGYLSPGTGFGASFAGPKLDKVKELIKNQLSTGSYSGMSFTTVTADTPFNFKDLEGATCKLAQAGAGIGAGYLIARLSVHGKTWYRTARGALMYGDCDFVTNVDVSGPDLQLGAGVSAVGGPLIKIA